MSDVPGRHGDDVSYYEHQGPQEVYEDDRDVVVDSADDPHVARIATRYANGSRALAEPIFVHADEVPSIIAALVSSTRFLERKPRDSATSRLQRVPKLVKDFEALE